jgi:hypothetical protein
MTKMTAPNGALVEVSEEKAERLLKQGYTSRSAASASTSPHASKNVADLKTEIERRNDGREEADLLSVEGKKADLVATLDADDAASDNE